jgi:UDP-N-acetylmuramoyl-tripeptide--D-alanyl-D-alanine ligase
MEELYQLYLSHPLITTDSRAIIRGSIFFALKGENFDGNAYALQSIEKGCSWAVVDDSRLKDNKRCIYVDDVLSSLQSLAKFHRNKLNIPVIGITGTNGKTTTKELTNVVLSKKFKTYATQGNFNNHIGVPLSILSIQNDIEMAIIEMGANHIGEIENLCTISQPNYGLITNIGIAHLEGFGSFEGVIQAKSELYHFLKEQTDSITFVHFDDDLLMKASKNMSRFTYGFSTNADTLFQQQTPDLFASVKWETNDSNILIKSQLIGDYNVPNIMAAICIGVYFGVSENDIKDAIEEYQPKNKRSQLLETEKNQLIVDAYNANPSSMIKAINNFNSMKVEHKLLILGDMLELGKESQSLHQEIVDHLKNLGIKNMILIGSEFAKCKAECPQFVSTERAFTYLAKKKIEKQSILLKGSRGMQLEKLIETL